MRKKLAVYCLLMAVGLVCFLLGSTPIALWFVGASVGIAISGLLEEEGT